LLTLAFKFDVAPVIKQQGQLLRPSPWPSFVAKQPSTLCSSNIIEPALRVTTASRRSEFLNTLQPAQLDYLIDPAKAPDNSEWYTAKVSTESSVWFSTKGIKGTSLEISSAEVVFNCYSRLFDSITECPSYNMISSQWYVLLEPVQSLMGG
jgi:hypothetical protein